MTPDSSVTGPEIPSCNGEAIDQMLADYGGRIWPNINDLVVIRVISERQQKIS